MHRLFELLSRAQYRPLRFVESGSQNGSEVSIFFARLDAPCWTDLRNRRRLTDCQTLMVFEPRSNEAIETGQLDVGNEDS